MSAKTVEKGTQHTALCAAGAAAESFGDVGDYFNLL